MAPGRADRPPRRPSPSVGRRAASPAVGVRGRCVALHGTPLRDTFHLGAHQRSPTCLTGVSAYFPRGHAMRLSAQVARRLMSGLGDWPRASPVAAGPGASRSSSPRPAGGRRHRDVARSGDPNGGQVVAMPLSACRRASRILRRHRRRVGVRAGIPGRGRSVRVAARAAVRVFRCLRRAFRSSASCRPV